MADDFRYDVAFSFLSAHEAVALAASDGLADRLSTFVYTRAQADVVGRNTDGVEAFTNVFRHESRVSVVLHSEGWGADGYTRIEADAIKERALSSGWEFLIVVCLDDAQPPKWIPTTKIWYGYKKYGMTGLIAAIDNRVTELGGRPRADPLLEKAARVQRERELEEARTLFGGSVEGFRRANAEIARLDALLQARLETLNAASPSLALSVAKNAYHRATVVRSNVGSCVIYWQTQYSNSLTGASLLVNEFDGFFSFDGLGEGPAKRGSLRAIPTLDYARNIVWRFDSEEEPMSTDALVDFLLGRLIERPTSPRKRVRFA